MVLPLAYAGLHGRPWQFWRSAFYRLSEHGGQADEVDMGGALYGKYMRTSILISITVSQIGFVCGKLPYLG